MKRKQAIVKCWKLVNSCKYVEADALLRKQTRAHGGRLFGYWLRLIIKNGLWQQETGQDTRGIISEPRRGD